MILCHITAGLVQHSRASWSTNKNQDTQHLLCRQKRSAECTILRTHILQNAAETQRVGVSFWHAQSAGGGLTAPLLPTEPQGHLYWSEIKSTQDLSEIKLCMRVLEGHFHLAAILGVLQLGLYCAPKPLLRALLLRVVQLGALHRCCPCRLSESSWAPQGLHILTILWYKWGRVPWKAFHSRVLIFPGA